MNIKVDTFYHSEPKEEFVKSKLAEWRSRLSCCSSQQLSFILLLKAIQDLVSPCRILREEAMVREVEERKRREEEARFMAEQQRVREEKEEMERARAEQEENQRLQRQVSRALIRLNCSLVLIMIITIRVETVTKGGSDLHFGWFRK